MLKECCIKWAVGDLRTSQYEQCGNYAERNVQGIMGIQRHGSQLTLGIGWIITKGSVKVRKGMSAIARTFQSKRKRRENACQQLELHIRT